MAKRLTGHATRGAGGARGKPGLILGAVFLAVGGFVVAVGTGWIEVDESSVHAPRSVIVLVGASFALGGLIAAAKGVAGLRSAARRARISRERPGERWHADHPWDPRGETATGGRPFRRALLGVVFLAVFLTPFNWWAFLSDAGGTVVTIVVSFFDLLLLLVLAGAATELVRMLRYGKSELLFDAFPFFLGERVAVRLRRSSGAAFDALRLTLRRVRELSETTGRGRSRTTRLVAESLWEEERTLSAEEGAAAPGRDLRLEFDLPADLPETRLSTGEPTYWELHARGETAGLDWVATFLVPVYAREAPAPAASRNERQGV